MNDFDMRERSDKAMTWLVIWFMASLIGTVWVVVLWLDPSRQIGRFLFALILSGGGFVIASLFAMRYSRYNALMHGDDGIEDDEPPDNGNASDMLLYNNIANPSGRIVVQTKDNQLLRSSFGFEPEQWLELVHALKIYGWKWERDKALKKSKLFKNLTKQGVFPRITDEFIRMKVVAGESRKYYVTGTGKVLLCDAAGLPHVI